MEKEPCFLRYLKQSHLHRLKRKFCGVESIESNYSQAFQDMFVLSVLDGKREGTYVEIGGYHPTADSNTYLLESVFGWKGIAFEIVPERVAEYNAFRKNKCLCEDATTVDYHGIFRKHGLPHRIDYLQVDIEPAENTLKALFRVPFCDYKFSVITFETDAWMYGNDVRDDSRILLSLFGYKMVAGDVTILGRKFEDWWVDPLVVSPEIIDLFRKHETECAFCVLEENSANSIRKDSQA